jgi:hypothetical protein
LTIPVEAQKGHESRKLRYPPNNRREQTLPPSAGFRRLILRSIPTTVVNRPCEPHTCQCLRKTEALVF